MLESAHIQIKGKVAEIIDKESYRQVSIICSGNNMMVKLKTDEDISLGDIVKLKGELNIESININGIELMTSKY